MKLALEQLGFEKCHHMLEVFPSRKQVNLWFDISEGKRPDWQEVFEGFQACVDFPASTVYRELIEAFPDAKVILTVRDASSWYDSAASTIYPASKKIPRWITFFVPHIRKIKKLSESLIWQKTLQGQFPNRSEAERLFDAHIEEVKRLVSADRLLVMHVKEGWAPLCKFLDVSIPSIPFPNVNDAAEFKKRLILLDVIRSVPWVVGFLALLVVSFLVWQLAIGAG